MSKLKKLLLVFAITFAAVLGTIEIRGTLLAPPTTGAWATAPAQMAVARSDAAAALLPDGRVLITGGNSGSGPVAECEFFNPDGSFAPAPSMNFARAGHTATLLPDGRVLVAGGTGATGAATQTAELFDPVANAWSVAGPLMVGRSGHTATLLANGQVLLAGGAASGAALGSLELFDPKTNTFALAPSVLTTARENHAAALLPDGRVLIVGGWDGTTAAPVPPATTGNPNVLASSDVFDPTTGAVSPGPALNIPRENLTATTAIDGSAAVIGGTNGQDDLASIEVLSPASGAFVLSSASLTTARQGHLAFLLPHNGNILVVGGTSSGTAVSAAELYCPWLATVTPTGSMSVARAGAFGSALSDGSLNSQNDGILMVAGGTDASGKTLSSAEAYGFAWIKADQGDYAPGTTVTVTGGGWQRGETLTISLVESPLIDTHGPFTVTVGSDGTFTSQTLASQDASCATDGTPCTFAPDSHDLNVQFTLTAVGSASQAQTMFADANHPILSVSGAGTGNGTVTSSDGNISCTVTAGVLSGTCSHTYSANFSSIILTATASGGSTFAGWSGGGGCTGTSTCSASETGNSTFAATATFNLAATATHFAVSPSTATPTAGSPFSVTVTAEDASNNTVTGYTGTVHFSLTNTDGGAALPANYTFLAGDAGVHTFTNGVTLTIAGAQTINTTDTNNSSITGSANVTVGAGSANSIIISSGSGQSATVNAAFANPLVALVRDTYLNPVSGVSVTFMAPSSGASGVFSNSTATIVAHTDAAGHASESFTANTIAGTYSVTASATGVATPATFSETNTPGELDHLVLAPDTAAVVVGQGQAYTATGYDQYDNSLGDVTGATTFSILPDGSCTVATCTPTAAGSHTVTGTDNTKTGTATLTVNKADTTTAITTDLSAHTVVGQSYDVAFTVTVNGPGSGTPTGTVTVSDGSQTCTASVATGHCSLTSTTVGAKTVTASYPGDSNFKSSASSGTAHTVDKADTTTSVTSSPAVSFGTVSVTLSATVSANSPSTATVNEGTVTFTIKDSTGATTIDTVSGVTVSSGAASTSYNITTPTLYAAGSYRIYAAYVPAVSSPNFNGSSSSGYGTLTINKAPTVTSVSPGTHQYSDLVTFTASITPDNILGIPPATAVTFKIGNTVMGSVDCNAQTANATCAVVSGSLVFTLADVPLLEPVNPAPGTPPAGDLAPGTPTVAAVFSNVNPNFTVVNATNTMTITAEDARVLYSSLEYFGFPSGTSNGKITLTATVWDISNSMFGPSGTNDPAYDTYPGDIRNATVTFVNRDAGDAPLCGPINVGLINPADTTTGSVSCETGNLPVGGSITVGIVVSDYYTRNSSDDDAVVNLTEEGTGSIGGGGHLVLTNAATGSLLPTAGLKNNFGFNVKYNKKGINLQGSINTIVRSALGLNGQPCSKTHTGFNTCVYQVKGNALSSLTANAVAKPTAAKPSTATFVGKASIQDVTDPNNTTPVDGGVSFVVQMTDAGSPGKNDQISFQVTKGGTMYFISNFSGGLAVQQLLAGGDLSVH
jgi:Bacterial Ig-like domain (group 3)/Galactose oxidase, central domain